MYKPPFNLLEELYSARCGWGAGQRVVRDDRGRVVDVHIHLFAVVPKMGYIAKELPLSAVQEDGYPVAHLIELLQEEAPNFLPLRKWRREENHYRVELRVSALQDMGSVVERSFVLSTVVSPHTAMAQLALKRMAAVDREVVFEAVSAALRASAMGKEPLLSTVAKEVQERVQSALRGLGLGINEGVERSEEEYFALAMLANLCSVFPQKEWHSWVLCAVDELPGQEVKADDADEE